MNIYEKLLEIRKSVDYLKKTAKNTMQNFNYNPSSQVLQSVREKMNEVGVILVPEVKDVKAQTLVNAKGTTQIFTEMYFTFTWLNVEKPDDKLSCPWYAQGIDTSEKGPGKAMTYGEKFFILKFFNIATDSHDPDAGTKPTPPPKPKQLPENPNINAQRQRAIDMIKASGHDIIQAQADYNKAKEAGACQEALDILQGHIDSLTDNKGES